MNPIPEHSQVTSLFNDEISCWVDRESCIMLRAITKSGDPVELNVNMAERFVEILNKMIKAIE